MMNRNLIYYYGKSRSTIGAAVLTQLQFYDHDKKHQKMSKFFAMDLFNYTCDPTDERNWFCPYPKDREIILSIFKIFEIDGELCLYEVKQGNFWDCARKCIKKGPFILGPIPTSRLWRMPETPYFAGFSHFINVYEVKEDCLVTCDLTGWPRFIISKNMVDKLLGSEKTYIFSFETADITVLQNQSCLYKNIFTELLNRRIELIEHDKSFGKGIQNLADKLRKEGIKKSQLLSLIYLNEEVNLSLQFLEEFLNLPFSILDNLHVFKEEEINEIMLIIDSYRIILRKLQLGLSEANNEKIIKVLYEIIHIEKVLTEKIICLRKSDEKNTAE